MANFYCEYCGHKQGSVNTLTAMLCLRHPAGANKGRHKLFQGREASSYTCVHCGHKSGSIATMTASLCLRHPSGANKGRHAPALGL